ncbi:hypothetical protein [Sulfitobacter sp.]|uniref:hypothetical protein n=1 Tax=Sulfitobacter sp. TaxID=1903071 RepID=UPI004059530D
MLQLLSLPLLSRVYAPVEFGIQYEVQSVATIIAVVYTLQLHLIIPLEKSRASAIEATRKVQSLCFMSFLVVGTAAVFAPENMVWAAVLALFVSLNNTYTSYLVQQGKFSVLSLFFIVRAALIVALQVAFAYLDVPQGLVLATVIGEGITSLYLWITNIAGTPGKHFVPRAGLRLARSTPSFSIYGTSQELISVAAFFAPFLLFRHVYDEGIAAQYAMSGRLIWAPVVLMGASISQVIYHEIGKAKEIDTSLIQSVLPRPTHIAALAVLCILAYVGRDVMLIILGPAWELSSDLSPLQMIWAAAFLLAIPSRTILRALHLQKLQLAIDIGVVIGIASLGLIPKMPPLQLMIIITIIGVLQNIGLFICGRYSLEIKNKLARLL